MSDTYDGDVVFVDGCHYAVGDDGHADMSRPLFWVADDPHPEAAAEPSGETHEGGGYYRDKTDADPSHFEAYHVNHVELDFGDDTIDVSPEDAQAVRDFLAQRKGDA